MGDYAVVHVTEAKGHTLRGELLYRTTLQRFEEEKKIIENALHGVDTQLNMQQTTQLA